MKDRDLLQWLEDADDLRHRHPRRALLRACALRDLAASLERPGDGTATDLQQRWWRLQFSSWAVLGSAYRSVGERFRAESALAVALAFIEPTQGDPDVDLDFARLAQRLSYVRCDQQRFEEALALNDDALRLFDRAEAPQLAASARVDRALFFHRSGRTKRAIPLLMHALGRLDEQAHPRVFLAAVHNLGFYLSLEARDAGEHREALYWLELGWRLHLDHPEEPGLLRLRAVAALMALRRGHVEEATEALASCRSGFAQLGAVAEQASVLLHLIALAFDEDRPRDVRTLAAQLAPILHHLELPEPARSVLERFLEDGSLFTEVRPTQASQTHQPAAEVSPELPWQPLSNLAESNLAESNLAESNLTKKALDLDARRSSPVRNTGSDRSDNPRGPSVV